MLDNTRSVCWYDPEFGCLLVPRGTRSGRSMRSHWRFMRVGITALNNDRLLCAYNVKNISNVVCYSRPRQNAASNTFSGTGQITPGRRLHKLLTRLMYKVTGVLGLALKLPTYRQHSEYSLRPKWQKSVRHSLPNSERSEYLHAYHGILH